MSFQFMHDRIADGAATTSAVAVGVGVTIGQVNQYLQAAAYVVAIISGLCAAYYYIRRAHRSS